MTGVAQTSPEPRKTARLTVVMTQALSDRLASAAAFLGLSKSVFAAEIIARELETLPPDVDTETEETERRQEDWRARRGF